MKNQAHGCGTDLRQQTSGKTSEVSGKSVEKTRNDVLQLEFLKITSDKVIQQRGEPPFAAHFNFL